MSRGRTQAAILGRSAMEKIMIERKHRKIRLDARNPTNWRSVQGMCRHSHHESRFAMAVAQRLADME